MVQTVLVHATAVLVEPGGRKRQCNRSETVVALPFDVHGTTASFVLAALRGGLLFHIFN